MHKNYTFFIKAVLFVLGFERWSILTRAAQSPFTAIATRKAAL